MEHLDNISCLENYATNYVENYVISPVMHIRWSYFVKLLGLLLSEGCSWRPETSPIFRLIHRIPVIQNIFPFAKLFDLVIFSYPLTFLHFRFRSSLTMAKCQTYSCWILLMFYEFHMFLYVSLISDQFIRNSVEKNVQLIYILSVLYFILSPNHGLNMHTELLIGPGFICIISCFVCN